MIIHLRINKTYRMKKIILTLLLTLYTICLWTQDFNDIQGFGKLRLGMTISEVKNIVDTSQLNDLSYYGAYDTLGDRFVHYLLGSYKINANEYIEDLDLKFIDNHLYEINIHKYSSKTELNLTQIYGKPEVKIREDDENKYTTIETKQWTMPLGMELIVVCSADLIKNRQKGSTSYALSLRFLSASIMVEDLQIMSTRNFRKKDRFK